MSLLAPSRPNRTNGPGPYTWTREEFHRLGDFGWFEGRRALLIHGNLIEEGPMPPLMPVVCGEYRSGWNKSSAVISP